MFLCLTSAQEVQVLYFWPLMLTMWFITQVQHNNTVTPFVRLIMGWEGVKRGSYSNWFYPKINQPECKLQTVEICQFVYALCCSLSGFFFPGKNTHIFQPFKKKFFHVFDFLWELLKKIFVLHLQQIVACNIF